MKEVFLQVLEEKGISRARIMKDMGINLYIDKKTITLATVERICQEYSIDFGLFFDGKVYSLK